MTDVFPVPENMTNVADLLPFASDITGGGLGVLLLLLIGGATWMITSSYSSKQSWLATAYMLTVSSLFLWVLELLSINFVWICIVGLIIGMGVSAFKGGGSAA